MANMNIILLSGGSGKRLWPLSNDIRSKQFIKIFKRPDNTYESMVQRVYRQLKAIGKDTSITIATSKSQVSAIHNQVGDEVGISVEPCRRDTFPAIALATAYLHDIKGLSDDDTVVVCPVDPFVDDSYFECIRKLFDIAKQGDKKLVLMGIQPTYPSEKYGYIKPTIDSNGNKCFTFTEKPTKEKAEEYIRAGALWNGGVFGYKLGYVLGKSKKLLGGSEYQYLYANYSNLKKISFDYAVVEQETSIEVLRYSGTWKDLGTWNTLSEAMEDSIIGNARMNESCSNVHIINDLSVPILAMGVHDIIISASPEGILVSDKEQSSFIKPYVDAIDQQIMFAEKSWGSYRVLDVEEDSMTIKVTLNPGHRMNYHSHEKRDEVWTVVSGKGKTVIDGCEKKVEPGDVIEMPRGVKHTIIADTEIQLIEVQIGEEISVMDKRKYIL